MDQDASHPRTVSRPDRLLFLLVFAGGFSSIGTELAASRLVAPYFGSSTFIWATLIGLTMTFLAVGYWLGGKVADSHPSASLLYGVTAGAALAIAAVPLISRPILRVSLDAFATVDVGAFYGSLVGSIFLLAIPITLLGFVTPFAIRLSVSDVDTAGNTSGSIYALSTVGSIAGSFLPVLLFIPLWGTTWTFIALSLVLLVPSLLGLLSQRRVGVAGIALLALIGAILGVRALSTSTIRPAERGTMLDERESAYNYLQVTDQDGARLLIMNEGHAIHSIYHPETLLTGGPWDYFMLAPLVVDQFSPDTVDNALIIGLAGGTAARQLAEAYPGIAITGVEIDPVVADLGMEWFGMGDIPNLTVEIADGRYALTTSSETFDLIAVDAYRQPYIPFHLSTQEFFDDVSQHLSPTGVAVVNVGRTETDYRLVDAIASTMTASFDHVFAVDVGRYMNTLVIGTNADASTEAFASNGTASTDTAILSQVAAWAASDGNLRGVAPGTTVFTDDHAPVELVIDQIILDAARELTTR